MSKLKNIAGILLPLFLSLTLAGVPTNAQEPTEIVSLRTLNSKTTDLGGGRYALDSTIGAVHYEDNGWQEIDNELVPGAAPWDWVMTEAGYKVGVNEDFTSGQVIQFWKQGSTVNLQPMALEWTNDLDQIQQISMPQNVTPVITNPEVELLPDMNSHQGTIRWDNAYGQGLDFEWQCTPTRLVKILQIDNLNNLPIPEPFIIAGGNPVLRLNLIFDPSDLDIHIDGEVWDKKKKTQTFSVIEFRKNGEVLWGFTPLMYWSSDLEELAQQSVATLEKRGNNLYISIRVPYTWLQNSVYPVFVDANVDVQVGASTDDCGRSTNSANYFTLTEVQGYAGYYDASYQNNGSAYRFLNVTVPSGATIDTATITFTCLTARSTTTVNTRLRAEANINPATFSTSANFDARTWTTALVNWDAIAAWTAETEYTSPEIKTCIQEVIGLPSWASGNPMAILWDDFQERSTQSNLTRRESYSYDGSSAKAAKLHIEYTPAGGNPPTVTTNAADDLEDTTATLNGEVTDDDGETIDYYGFVWDTVADAGDPADTDPSDPPAGWEFGWKSGVGDYGIAVFDHAISGLPTGTTIHFRAAAHNVNGWAYGAAASFLTKPAKPTDVAATENLETKVTITWTKSTGATTYWVERNNVAISGLVGDVDTWDDNTAVAGTITSAGSVSASDGTSTAHVTLSLAGETTGHTSYNYQVVASNVTGDSDDSALDPGWRVTGAVTYQWQDNDGGWANVAGASTTDPFNDTSTPAGTITAGNTVASDGASPLHVVLSLAGDGVVDGASMEYRCICSATNASNSPQTSDTDTGYRGTDTVTLQWQDDDGGWANIPGGTTDPYNDTAAPAPTVTPGTATASDGTSSDHSVLTVAGHSGNDGGNMDYKCIITGAWASNSPQTTASNIGYRGIAALTYAWQKSAGDADGGYGALGGATTNPYNDIAAAITPDGRWYYGEVSMAGAATQDTDHNRGYRLVPPAPPVAPPFISSGLEGSVALGLLISIGVILTFTMFVAAQPMLGFACSVFWAISGTSAYALSSTPWGDIYYFIFIACLLGMTIFTMLAAFGLRHKDLSAPDAEVGLEEGG